MPDQANAAQDKRAHHDFSDVCLPQRHVFKIRTPDTQDAALCVGSGTDQILPTAEEVKLASELTCDKQHNPLGVTRWLKSNDLNFTFKDHKEVNVSIPSCEDRRAFGDCLLSPIDMEPVQHLRSEPRERFSLAFIRIRKMQVC